MQSRNSNYEVYSIHLTSALYFQQQQSHGITVLQVCVLECSISSLQAPSTRMDIYRHVMERSRSYLAFTGGNLISNYLLHPGHVCMA